MFEIKPLIMLKLTVPWEEFNLQILRYIDEIDQFEDIDEKDPRISEFHSKFKKWYEGIIQYLEKSITESDYFTAIIKEKVEHYWGGNVFSLASVEHKTRLQKALTRIHKITNVCDSLTEGNSSKVLLRSKFTTEETLELILEKLYELYDGQYYPINIILRGNGISISKWEEPGEYAEILSSRKLIEFSDYDDSYSSCLTLKGKMHIENRRKKSSSDYSSVSNDKEKLFEKLDEILKETQKSNLGNEILFEEIEELKFAYEKLSKKNWGQLLKGKLLDLVISQVINEDVARLIFQEIANMPLHLK